MTINEFQQRAPGIFGRVQGLADRVVAPTTRQQFYGNVSAFANEQPLLSSFLAAQILLSFTPLALFASFAIATILFSFISALLFSLFWVGAALFILIPVLFVTVSLGIALWVWAVSSFLLARWVYNMLPFNVRGGMEVGIPNGKTVVVNKSGEGFGDIDAKVKQSESY